MQLDRQVPGVQEVRKTAEYRQFAEQVIQKEADSLQRLGLKAPHLAPGTTSTSCTGSHTYSSLAKQQRHSLHRPSYPMVLMQRLLRDWCL